MHRLCLVLTTALLSASCGGVGEVSSGDASSASAGAKEKSSTSGNVESVAARGEVKIMHDGKVLASYLSAQPDAALDNEYQTLGLNLNGSNSENQMLMIVVEEQKAGVYPLDGSWGGKDKLSVMFTTDVLPTPSLAFETGELNITELTDKHCSGTFKAVGTAGSKKGYSVEATFSKLPVVGSARDTRK